jgi:uncharacterized oligopeptide transporter (OPT) family protein
MNYQTINMDGDASERRHRIVERPSMDQPPTDILNDDSTPIDRAPATSPQSFTPRSLLVGLIIGALITFSNTYFGLQTGWISTMAMPSALIGFSVFKVLSKHLSFPFTPVENVLIQTVAGAVGTMPLGCGFVGVIPALEFLMKPGEDGPEGDGGEGEGGPLNLSFWKLVIWSLGVCLFGVVFAVPLRKEVIVREKLRFPSGTASALMLKVLHGAGSNEKVVAPEGSRVGLMTTETESASQFEEQTGLLKDNDAEDQASKEQDWRSKMRLLVGAFTVSGVYVNHPVKLRKDHANISRLSSHTSSLWSVIFPCLARAWRTTGCGRSTRRRHISAKVLLWAHQHACTCSSEQSWGGASYHH